MKFTDYFITFIKKTSLTQIRTIIIKSFYIFNYNYSIFLETKSVSIKISKITIRFYCSTFKGYRTTKTYRICPIICSSCSYCYHFSSCITFRHYNIQDTCTF